MLVGAGRVARIVILWTTAGCASLAVAQNPTEPTEEEGAASLASMQRSADDISIALRDGTSVERLEKPIYRYTDPARKFIDGSIWAWGKTGRPKAIAAIAGDERPERYVVEVVVLSDAPIRCSLKGQLYGPVAPEVPGEFSQVKMKPIPNVQPPATSEVRRRSQLKAIARKFSGYELWDNNGTTDEQRYELRLLESPIYEYQDEANGIKSGAIFILNYGSNPEMALIVEAHKDKWMCGSGQLGWAKAVVQYEGNAILEQESYTLGQDDSFYLFMGVPRTDGDAAANK